MIPSHPIFRASSQQLAGAIGLALGALTVEGYLSRGTATRLDYLRDKGDHVYVNGEYVQIGAAGLTRLTTDNLIDATGADAGAAMAVSTFYYIYISNSQSPFSPLSIRASATAWTRVNGVKYLGAAGNALNWRFIGRVRTNAVGAGQLQFDNTFIGVHNEYNKRVIRAGTAPGYVDDNAQTTYTKTVGVFSQANGGTGSRIIFIGDGEETVWIGLSTHMSPAAGTTGVAGISVLDSTTDTDEATLQGLAATGIPGGTQIATLPTEGAHTVDLLVASDVGTTTFIADTTRRGAVNDPAVTLMELRMLG